MFVLAGSLPVIAILYASFDDTLGEHFLGVWWTAAMVNACIACATRASEIIRTVDDLKRSVLSEGMKGVGGTPQPKPSKINPVAASVCVMAAFLGIFWTTLATAYSPHLSNDLVIPAAGLILLATKRGVILTDSHPLITLALYTTAVWLVSSLYRIFVMGYGEQPEDIFEPQYGLFRDEDISIWTSPSKWLPWLSFAMTLVPLPAVVFSFLRRKDDSEEMMFVLAVLSALPIIGAQSTPIRLLGVVGLLFGSWRCWDIGQTGKRSERLI